MLGVGSASEVLERAAKRAARIALMDSCGLESEEANTDRTDLLTVSGLNTHENILIFLQRDQYSFMIFYLSHRLFFHICIIWECLDLKTPPWYHFPIW